MDSKYQFVTEWESADEVFVARVTEFPSLAAHGDTRAEAEAELSLVLDAVLKDMKAEGEPIPEPLSIRDYSGKFNVRVPPELHRALVSEAARSGVSLNQLITAKLARSQG